MFKSNSNGWLVALLALVLLAFALRMVQIGQLRMWGDEGFSVYSANRDLVAISFDSKDVDPHPPLYYYLLHFYLPIAGFSELSIRFLSVFFGTATVALIYAIGKQMFYVRVGLLAAAIAAVAPFGIQYSQEVRMYALVMFLGAIAMWFFVRIANSELLTAKSQITNPKPTAHGRLWVGFFAAMFLTQYSLYQTAFMFVAQGVFLLPFLRRRFPLIVRWLTVSVVIVILFLPWLLTHSGSALADIQDVAGGTAPMNLPTFLARGFAAISAGPTIPLNNGLTLAALFAATIVLGLGLACVTRTAKLNDWLLVAFVAVPMASLYPIYFVAPLYRGRLFAVAFVPLLLLIARSASILISRARLVAVPLALLVLGTSTYSLNSYYFQYNRYSAAVEDYVPAIQMIEQHAQPGDVVLFHAYWQQGYFLSHYHGPPLTYAALENQTDLAAAVSQPRSVWAIIQGLPFHPVEYWLAQHAFPLGENDFGQMRVLSYRAGTPARGETFATPITFDNGIQLLGYHANDTPVESGGGIVTVQLDWQAGQKIDRDYSVSLRLTNPAGDQVWAQADGRPSSGTEPTLSWKLGQTVSDRHALTIPSGTPPGTYALEAVLYDINGSAVANIVAPDNLRGQAVWLGTVDVVRSKTASPEPLIPNPIDARWNEIALVGTGTLPEEIAAGETLPLTLFWQARQKPTHDYRVHILVLDSADGWRASDIQSPASEAFPTSQWQAGEIWTGKFRLQIDRGAVPGDLSVFIFVMDEKSDETLALETRAPARDLEIKGSISPQNVLVHAVRIAVLRIPGIQSTK